MASPQSNAEDEAATSLLFASRDDFETLDLFAVLAGVNQADDYALEKALDRAAGEAVEAGSDSAGRGYRLLSIFCTFHMRVEDQAEIWGPRWQSENGRAYIPSDFRGEQTNILADVAGAIPHPALGARVADVVWYNDRLQRKTASLAIDAYCDLSGRRLNGAYVHPYAPADDDVVLDVVDYLHRALQITSLTRKRGSPMGGNITAAFDALYERARASSQYIS